MTMMLRRGGGVEDGICGRTESSCVVPEIDWDRDLKTGLWLGTGYWVLRHPLALCRLLWFCFCGRARVMTVGTMMT